jgi:formylmethanofuran dehydrogenase subunit E
MPKVKHLHKYRKVNLTVNPTKAPYWVFKCTLPDCTHYLREDMVEGKMVICNVCDEPMLMTRAAMLLARPHCINCTKFKDKEEKDALADYLKKTGL